MKHPSTFLKQPGGGGRKKSCGTALHMSWTQVNKKWRLHLPLLPTDIAVMLTTLPTGVNNVVTTVKNTGKSTAAWTVVLVPSVEESGWSPRLLWMGVEKRKSFLYWSLHPPSIQPVVSCHTEYTTPVPFGARQTCFCQRNMFRG